jgi:hypothetical protein
MAPGSVVSLHLKCQRNRGHEGNLGVNLSIDMLEDLDLAEDYPPSEWLMTTQRA